jgi:hypothetical protein
MSEPTASAPDPNRARLTALAALTEAVRLMDNDDLTTAERAYQYALVEDATDDAVDAHATSAEIHDAVHLGGLLGVVTFFARRQAAVRGSLANGNHDQRLGLLMIEARKAGASFRQIEDAVEAGHAEEEDAA